jgi:hypothetical protein
MMAPHRGVQRGVVLVGHEVLANNRVLSENEMRSQVKYLVWEELYMVANIPVA